MSKTTKINIKKSKFDYEKMNDEQAVEILTSVREKIIKEGLINKGDKYTLILEDRKFDFQQALKIAIDSINEDKVTLLYCADGKVYVVDSEKSLDELSSESCDKCKRNEEQFEPYFEIKPEPYERSDKK